MDELAFLGTNGKPCLVTDDPLADAYLPEASQDDQLDDKYPPDYSG